MAAAAAVLWVEAVWVEARAWPPLPLDVRSSHSTCLFTLDVRSLSRSCQPSTQSSSCAGGKPNKRGEAAGVHSK